MTILPNRNVLAAGIALLCAAPVLAAPPKPAAGLPTAEQILTQSDAATGGASAKLKTMVQKMTLSVAAQKLSGSAETRVKLPNKFYSKQSINAGGMEIVSEQGYDGVTAWSRDLQNGLQTLTGEQAKQLQNGVNEMASGDWHRQYAKPVMLGLRKVGTADAYAIRLTPKTGGNPTVMYFDVKTKLPVRADAVAVTSQGSIPTQSFLSDYRTVSGMKVPFKTRQVAGGQEVLITVQSVEINAPVDDAVFKKPAAAAPTAAKP